MVALNEVSTLPHICIRNNHKIIVLYTKWISIKYYSKKNKILWKISVLSKVNNKKILHIYIYIWTTNIRKKKMIKDDLLIKMPINLLKRHNQNFIVTCEMVSESLLQKCCSFIESTQIFYFLVQQGCSHKMFNLEILTLWLDHKSHNLNTTTSRFWSQDFHSSCLIRYTDLLSLTCFNYLFQQSPKMKKKLNITSMQNVVLRISSEIKNYKAWVIIVLLFNLSK